MGDLTLFEALTGGAFDRLNWQHSGEFDQNFSKKSNVRRFARGGMGGFGIDRYITRLVNQINRHIDKQLSKETIASLKLNLEKAVSQLENVNQTLFELNPEDDEPEYWMEQTLAPVYDCFDNIEICYAERATLDAKLVKEVDVVLVPEPSNPLEESVDKSFSYDNSKRETSVVQSLPSTCTSAREYWNLSSNTAAHKRY